MPTPPILLRIDALGLEAFQCHEHAIVRLAAFGEGERHTFAEWLKGRHRKARYRILADLPDESHELETLPRVRGADRRALVSRRLATWYPQPAYAKAETLAVDRQANTEQVLFSGLARPARIEAWIAVLHDAGLAGERLVPASELIAHFLPSDPGLVVSFSRAGMRLTLAEGRRARLSRLVEGFSAETSLQDTEWRAEVDRTLHYASSIQPGRGERIQVVVLAPATVAGDAPPPPGGTSLRHLDPAELGPPLADTPATDSSALLLRWLARAPRRLGWPDSGHGAATHPRRALSFTLGAGLLLFIGGAGMAGLDWKAAQEARERNTALERDIGRLQRERAAVEAGHADLDAPPAQIIHSMRLVTRERSAAVAPLAVLGPMAAILDHSPGLALQTLDWSASPTGDTRQAFAQVKLSLSADTARQPRMDAAGNAALDAFIARLSATGAQDIGLRIGSGGDAHVELLLPLGHTQGPHR
ncbi:hypothetical protein [Thauera linaloolentis]|uniref:Uncharacterized protein n=1 Tax=Thauera linaloolentis (strain DSM 12138 / JCM 21573 / CCUG 41526 / CIP 105981 / IAM 15112 / NBRC 102519 / 47Lol) TaxID=1123367 RepID=N6Y4V4_THAL4|nr:hypothetical protein [Thauera linaloolentis]ENO89221.1 hypothetical protein C666_07160 [Thauera linaloolentis 47Lol = DSM 12138]MCM8564298.1 hypothetical protein [Thauera linaloolentis]